MTSDVTGLDPGSYEAAVVATDPATQHAVRIPAGWYAEPEGTTSRCGWWTAIGAPATGEVEVVDVEQGTWTVEPAPDGTATLRLPPGTYSFGSYLYRAAEDDRAAGVHAGHRAGGRGVRSYGRHPGRSGRRTGPHDGPRRGGRDGTVEHGRVRLGRSPDGRVLSSNVEVIGAEFALFAMPTGPVTSGEFFFDAGARLEEQPVRAEVPGASAEIETDYYVVAAHRRDAAAARRRRGLGHRRRAARDLRRRHDRPGRPGFRARERRAGGRARAGRREGGAVLRPGHRGSCRSHVVPRSSSSGHRHQPDRRGAAAASCWRRARWSWSSPARPSRRTSTTCYPGPRADPGSAAMAVPAVRSRDHRRRVRRARADGGGVGGARRHVAFGQLLGGWLLPQVTAPSERTDHVLANDVSWSQLVLSHNAGTTGRPGPRSRGHTGPGSATTSGG